MKNDIFLNFVVKIVWIHSVLLGGNDDHKSRHVCIYFNVAIQTEQKKSTHHIHKWQLNMFLITAIFIKPK